MPRPSLARRLQLILLIAAASATGCRGADEPPQPAAVAQPSSATPAVLYPDVLAAKASRNPDGTWRFDVTLSSPYDKPERYADAWHVLAPDGTELGIRVLTHDHASEQPFTRTLESVSIPPEITSVVVQGRDMRSGWGGAKVEVALRGG